MQIKVKQQDDVITALLYGELDHTAPRIRAGIPGQAYLEVGNSDLVLDLKNLSFMDSSGISVIIGRYKKLKSDGRRMYVTNPNRQIDKVMSLSGLYSIIKKL